MNEQVLKNIVVFMNRAAESGAVKTSVDAMAFAEAYQAVQAALSVMLTPSAPPPVTP